MVSKVDGFDSEVHVLIILVLDRSLSFVRQLMKGYLVMWLFVDVCLLSIDFFSL